MCASRAGASPMVRQEHLLLITATEPQKAARAGKVIGFGAASFAFNYSISIALQTPSTVCQVVSAATRDELWTRQQILVD
jgi:hypothetical protein